MIYKWNVTIPKLTGDQTRRAYIYLPQSYDHEPHKRYPVLYMFDGHNVFFDEDATYGKSWGMKKYLDETATQLIVVAVECNHSPDHGRLKEYAPYSFTDLNFGHITGKGAITLEWFTKKLKPHIDHHFRTLPDRDHTFIAGSSMGGLMSLYAVLAHNDIFGKAAALSPSIWTCCLHLELLIHSTKINPNTTIYMDYGSEEMARHRHIRYLLKRIVTHLMDKQVFLTYRVVPFGEHCEASWERQLPHIIPLLMYGLE